MPTTDAFQSIADTLVNISNVFRVLFCACIKQLEMLWQIWADLYFCKD